MKYRTAEKNITIQCSDVRYATKDNASKVQLTVVHNKQDKTEYIAHYRPNQNNPRLRELY